MNPRFAATIALQTPEHPRMSGNGRCFLDGRLGPGAPFNLEGSPANKYAKRPQREQCAANEFAHWRTEHPNATHPSGLEPVDLREEAEMKPCPKCQRPTEIFLVWCDGHCIEVNRCRDHGDAVPLRNSPCYPAPDLCAKPDPPRDEEPGIYAVTPGNVWDGEGP